MMSQFEGKRTIHGPRFKDLKTISRNPLAASLMMCLVALAITGSITAKEKMVVGLVERVRIFPGDLTVTAKLDTGALNTSLSARELETIVKSGEEWVRFSVLNRNGVAASFERKVARYAKIKRHGAESQRRPVVLLGVCLGKFFKEAEVNLVDRTGFIYPMLIGRRFFSKQGHCRSV